MVSYDRNIDTRMMIRFRVWLLLKENLDRAAFNGLFQRELEALLPKISEPVKRQYLSKLREFDWIGYIGAAVRNAGFRSQEDVQERIHEIVVKLLIAPGGLFRDYDDNRHGLMDRRFKRSVGNAIRNMIAKEKARRRHIPVVPIHVGPEPAQIIGYKDDDVVADFRNLVSDRLGELALAVLDVRLAGDQTQSLLGRPDLGRPSRSRIKQVVRRIKRLAHEYAIDHDHPGLLDQVEKAMRGEAKTVEKRRRARALEIAIR